MKSEGKETKRAIFHIVLAFIIVLIYSLFGRRFSLTLFITSLFAGFILSLVSRKYKVPIIYRLLEIFERGNAALPGIGAFFYLLSSTICIIIFPENIAFASILFLGVGDGLATLVGKKGKIKFLHSRKTLEGSISGLAGGILTTIYFVNPRTAIIAGMITMVFESFDLPFFLDDNLIIPLLFGIISYLLM